MLEYTLRTYQSPTRLVQRLGAIRELGTEAGLLGIRRPLLVTDPGVKAAGLLDTALEVLRGADCEPVVFDRVRPTRGSSWWMPAQPSTAHRAVTASSPSAEEAPWTPPRGSGSWRRTTAASSTTNGDGARSRAASRR